MISDARPVVPTSERHFKDELIARCGVVTHLANRRDA